MATDRRQSSPVGFGQQEQLLHDTENHLGPGGNLKFLEKPVHVRMNRMRRDGKILRDGRFGEVVKNRPNELLFARRQLQGSGDLDPGFLAQQPGTTLGAGQLPG
jgi:hypothetical protein